MSNSAETRGSHEQLPVRYCILHTAHSSGQVAKIVSDPPATSLCSIYDSIGKGMHSTVYKGRKKKTIEYFAIKSVAKSQKQRVHQEVRSK